VTKLDLQRARLGDAGVRALLPSLAHPLRLRDVDLSRCAITPECQRAFSEQLCACACGRSRASRSKRVRTSSARSDASQEVRRHREQCTGWVPFVLAAAMAHIPPAKQRPDSGGRRTSPQVYQA
jgi:hypothetical protein